MSAALACELQRLLYGQHATKWINAVMSGAYVTAQDGLPALRWIGDSDPTTRLLIESTLEEEERADGLNDLLGNYTAAVMVP